MMSRSAKACVAWAAVLLAALARTCGRLHETVRAGVRSAVLVAMCVSSSALAQELRLIDIQWDTPPSVSALGDSIGPPDEDTTQPPYTTYDTMMITPDGLDPVEVFNGFTTEGVTAGTAPSDIFWEAQLSVPSDQSSSPIVTTGSITTRFSFIPFTGGLFQSSGAVVLVFEAFPDVLSEGTSLEIDISTLMAIGRSTSGSARAELTLILPDGTQQSQLLTGPSQSVPFSSTFGMNVGERFTLTLSASTLASARFASSSALFEDLMITADPKVFTLDVVDPNPSFIDQGSSTLESDPSMLTDGGTPRLGLASDGVTPMLVRTSAEEAGDFSFSATMQSGSGTAGVFFDLGTTGGAGVSTLTVPSVELDGMHYGFAYYIGPADASPESIVSIAAAYTSDDGLLADERTTELEIIAPPVVFMHGLWSSSGTWTPSLLTSLFNSSNPKFVVEVHDYSSSNSSPFSANINQPYIAGQRALLKARSRGYAATQFDIVGHSMGGILSRLYIAQSSQYRRPGNFDLGDVRRLITLGTPHSGSEGADVLYALLTSPNPLSASAAAAMIGAGMNPFGGAVSDLRTSTSLPAVAGIETHAIVGTGGDDVIANLAITLAQYSSIESAIYTAYLLLGVDGSLIYPGEHDLIVSTVSQRGGLGSNATSKFGYLNEDRTGTHTQETMDPDMLLRAHTLLRLPPGSPEFANGFPAVTGSPRTASRSLNQSIPREQVDGIELVSPAGGSVLSASDPLTFVVSPINGFAPTQTFVFTSVGAGVSVGDPNTVTVATPSQFGANVTATIISLDSSGDFALLEGLQYATELPSSALSSFEPRSTEFFLLDDAPTARIVIDGELDDETLLFDLAAEAFGVLFASQDESVAVVDATGIVTAVGPGETLIDVTNSNSALSGSFTTVAVTVVEDEVPADLTGDGIVDTFDLAQLLAQWGGTGTADLNDDGVVDTFDLAIVLAAWD